MTRPVDRSLTPRDPLIGRVLDERYRVLRRIGKGGMGNVYLAEHVLIGRKVAVKTLHETLCNPELIERFHREARAAAAVGNEHVVDVTDMGYLDGGSCYLVLEYLEGSDLAFRVAERGPLPVASAVGLLLQLCAALRAVHAAGIVHRDLKPDNLFLIERDGSPDFLKVLDFGVCKFRESAEQMRLTATGVALGTPHYMAPEQVEGRNDVDRRADIYAAGGILHFALTGAPPFDGPSMPSLFMQICDAEPRPVRGLRADVPPALERVVLRALAKRREDRFQDALQLSAELQAVLAQLSHDQPRSVRDSMHEGQTLPAIEPSTRIPATLPGRRRWPLRVTAAVLGTGLALGAAQLARRAEGESGYPRPRAAPAPDTSLAPATETSVPQPIAAGPESQPTAPAPGEPAGLPLGASAPAPAPASAGEPRARRVRRAQPPTRASAADAEQVASPDPPSREAERLRTPTAEPPPSNQEPPIAPHGELRPVFGDAPR